MEEGLVSLLVGASRLGLYVGFVMAAGSVLFWVLVWPDAPANPHVRRAMQVGVGLLALFTVLVPLLQWLGAEGELTEVVPREGGAAALVRLAVLAASTTVMPGLAARRVTGRTAGVCLAAVGIVTLTLVLQSNAIEGGLVPLKVVATTGHLLATACWLGGLVVLATVIIPREDVAELDRFIPRFSRVAFVSVIVLVVTGAVHALAVAGGIPGLVESDYGAWLGIKAVVFVGMLGLGNHGRKYAAAAVLRQLSEAQAKRSSAVQTLAVVMGAELAIAGTVLALTAALVAAAPPSA